MGTGCKAEEGGAACGRPLVVRESRYSGLAVCSRHYDREKYRANLSANPDYYKQKRTKNPEAARAAVRRSRLAHLEEHRERDGRYYLANRAKKRAEAKARYQNGGVERSRERRETHPEENLKAAARRRVEFGPAIREASRLWRLKHPDTVRDQSRRSRARRVAALVVPYRGGEIFERDGWWCQLCERPIDPRQPRNHPWSRSLDHILPLTLGGDDAPWNVWPAHLRCNIQKRARYEGKPPDGPESLWGPDDQLNWDQDPPSLTL